MKNEQEFLTSMWSEINVGEREAKQKLFVHDLSKQLFIRELFAYATILVLLAGGGSISFLMKDNPSVAYTVAILLFATAFFAEKLYYSQSQGVIRK